MVADYIATGNNVSCNECVRFSPQIFTCTVLTLGAQNKLASGQLSACAKSCAPTLGMLRLSESPVATLSQGTFGTQTGLAASKVAPDPDCEKTPAPLTQGRSAVGVWASQSSHHGNRERSASWMICSAEHALVVMHRQHAFACRLHQLPSPHSHACRRVRGAE